jgi:putative nucleotidyltransferase with HDIG domain
LGPLISRVNHLPSLPQIYLELAEELGSPNASDKRIGQIIARDPALTAKLLQLVNSAFFGLPRRIVQLQQAVSLLGRSTVKSLVLLLKVSAGLKLPPAAIRHVENVCQHSIQAASLARKIAQLEACALATIETAELAAVLHDIGKLALLDQLGDEYCRLLDEAARGGARTSERERLAYGASHAQVGAHLLGLWGLPEEVSFAVGAHNQPGRFGPAGFNEISVVHAADALSRELERGDSAAEGDAVDMAYLRAIGREQRWPLWREAAGLPLRQGAGHVG